MYLILLVLLAPLLIHVIVHYIKNRRIKKDILRELGFNFVITVMLGSIVCAGVSRIIYEVSDKEVVVVDTKEIVSLSDGNEINGRFFLGSGFVGETMYYYTYVRIGDDSFKLKKLRANETIIHEDVEDAKDANFTITAGNVSEEYIKWTLYDIIHAKHTSPDCTHKTYHLHVPKGTIVRDFKLDN